MTDTRKAMQQAWAHWVGKRSDLLDTRHNENIFKAGFEAALAQQQQPVAYLAWRDGKPCYAGEDVVCADPVWPVDSDDDRTSMPVYTGAAPAAPSDDKDLLTIAAMDAYQMGKRDALAQQGEPVAQPDARKVIEQMVVALEIAERHLAYVEITEAKEAGQQWLEENK